MSSEIPNFTINHPEAKDVLTAARQDIANVFNELPNGQTREDERRSRLWLIANADTERVTGWTNAQDWRGMILLPCTDTPFSGRDGWPVELSTKQETRVLQPRGLNTIYNNRFGLQIASDGTIHANHNQQLQLSDNHAIYLDIGAGNTQETIRSAEQLQAFLSSALSTIALKDPGLPPLDSISPLFTFLPQQATQD